MAFRRSHKASDQKPEHREDAEGRTAPPKSAQPRFPRPKVLAIDLPEGDVDALRAAGYNVAAGTFGQPLKVMRAPGQYRYLRPTARLPNYTEQEVVIADIARPDPVVPVDDEREPAPAENSVWVRLDSGVIDPRPRIMRMVREEFDRTHRHGGVFILLADGRTDPGYVVARPYGGGVSVERELGWDNWGCVSLLDSITVTHDHGVEMEPPAAETARVFPLARYLRDGHFDCVIQPQAWLIERWVTLAVSKYGDPVAGILGPAEDAAGWIIILPRIQGVGHLVRELLDELLPGLAPTLFPHAEGTRWTRRAEYELPQVLELTSQIETVERDSRERIRALESKTEDERKKHASLHELLTESGPRLVSAVN